MEFWENYLKGENMIPQKVYTVSQINRYIRGIFTNDIILQSFWIKGEISNLKHHSSGNLYFTLKDEDSAISCIMFKGNAYMMPYRPENGMLVTACGYVNAYEKTGQYQLYVEFMEPTAIGALAAGFEQMKLRLEEEGLFDTDFKREICKRPKTIAVITSPTGAVVRDIVNVSKRRNKGVQIVVVPTLVQGESAADEIVKAIKAVNLWGEADTIIVGRGGGSIEDLWAFNEETVARAIFASEIPIISAVGHETDVTIADFVSDLRAPTPSAAAELAINDVEGDKNLVRAQSLRLDFAIDKIIEMRKKHVEAITKSSVLRKPKERLANTQLELDRSIKRVESAFDSSFMRYKDGLLRNIERLEILSPMGVLKRGYSVTFDNEEKVISSIKQIKKDDLINIKLQDGSIKAVVKGVDENDG